MKRGLCFLMLLYVVAYSQPRLSKANIINSASNISVYAFKKGFSNNNGVYTSRDKENSIKGSKFLFTDFDNKGILMTTLKNEKYSINNINIDLVRNNFVSKIDKDTLYYFNNVSRAQINNSLYEKVDGKIYEKLISGGKISIYALHNVNLRNEVIDKLSYKVIEPKRWVKNEKIFYTLEEKALKELKINKTSVLNIFNEKNGRLIKNYVKKNKLSYRKKEDIIKLIQHYYSL